MGSEGGGEGERGKEKGKQSSISSLPLSCYSPPKYFITDFLQLLLKGGDHWRVMAIQGHSMTGKSSQSDYLPVSMIEKECLLRKPVEQCSVV